MIYPATYNELAAWVGTKKLCSFYELTQREVEEYYEAMRDHKLDRLLGTPDGKIFSYYKDGRVLEIQVATSMDPNTYESISVTEAGVVITYTAAYIAAHRSSSSYDGGSGSNNNNNNNNNNN